MNIYLSEQGDQLPGDLLLEWVNRSDLAPVPRTVEFVVRLKNDLASRLVKGAPVWTGWEHLKYTIVKRERAQPNGQVQGDEAQQAVRFTALLDSCKSIAEPCQRAVIAQNASLGGLYRACGARVAIGNDFTVSRFACLVGDVPSKAIAVALQEEGAALVLRRGRLSIERLHSLMAQAPVDTIGQLDSTAAHDSDLTERHEIPMCFSLDAMGGVVRGDFTTIRNARFIPGMDARTLHNLSHVLVTRQIADSQLAQQILAGDIVTVGAQRLLVITAAHRFRQRQGITDSSSRFWLGEVSQ